METTLRVLTNVVSEAFQKCGYDKSLGNVTESNRLDLCQFQCNGAFTAAKTYRKSPILIADDIAALLKENHIFQKAEVAAPGFINLTLTDEYMLNILHKIADDVNIGIPQIESSETIVLDYGGPNIAKPLHVGHLRAAIIGESLKRLAKSMGMRVTSDAHLGDWGLQIGLVIAELEERNPLWNCFSSAFNADINTVPTLSVSMLNEIYPFASRKSKIDKLFKSKADRATFKLQNGHDGYTALWKEIMRVSISDLKENYNKLNVNFDLWYGESDSEKYINVLINKLVERGLLYKSEGAMVVDVEEETDKSSMPPVIIKKTDNTSNYATTDLATIIQRQKDFAPDKIWYVVDKRQSLHFTQVFRCARKAGLVPQKTELEHLGFGTMNGSDGKPYKTRDGGVMRLSDLLDTIINASYEKINTPWLTAEDEKKEVARRIGIAAVKFGDLVNHRLKDYIFDLDRFLSFEGKTGVYLLYTITRINSILKKVNDLKELEFNCPQIFTDAERNLIFSIILSGETFLKAIREKAPNIICENAFRLASDFSNFYHTNNIINETDELKKATWVSLCILTRKLLIKHLDVLGIEPVERM